MRAIKSFDLSLSKLEVLSTKFDNMHVNSAKVQSVNHILCETGGDVGYTEDECKMSI